MTCHREWNTTPKLYMGNLEPTDTEEEIEAIFGRYGAIKQIWMSQDVTPGFAFVEFESEHDTNLAARALDGLIGKPEKEKVPPWLEGKVKGFRNPHTGVKHIGDPGGPEAAQRIEQERIKDLERKRERERFERMQRDGGSTGGGGRWLGGGGLGGRGLDRDRERGDRGLDRGREDRGLDRSGRDRDRDRSRSSDVRQRDRGGFGSRESDRRDGGSRDRDRSRGFDRDDRGRRDSRDRDRGGRR